MGRVTHVGEERVGVDVEGRAGLGEEVEQRAEVHHELVFEDAGGGRVGVGDHVEAHRRGALDPRQPRTRQGAVQVPHRREDALRGAALHLVAHGDVLDVHRGVVGLHVALHPRRRVRGAAREPAKLVVAGVEHEDDARVAQGVERVGVGGVDAHAVDALGPVELNHVAAGRQVVAQHAVADADGVHACTQSSCHISYLLGLGTPKVYTLYIDTVILLP